MTVYLEVAVLAPLQRASFHYHVPEGFPAALRRGHLVVVPFASQRIQGVVLREVDHPEVPNTRPIEDLLDPEPVLTDAQLVLAQWMAKYYCANLDACLSAMLPPGLARHAEAEYSLADSSCQSDRPVAKRLIRMLAERGSLRTGQIRRAMGPVEWQREADRMVRAGILQRASQLGAPDVRPKHVRLIRLILSPEEAASLVQKLRDAKVSTARRKAAERRARVLECLAAEQAPVATDWVFASSGATLADLKYLAAHGWAELVYEETLRDPLANRAYTDAVRPTLTGEQESALAAIRSAAGAHRAEPFLLFGITGSGKTEVYLRAVEETIARGQRAIILVPEIALTPQTVERFGRRFPGRIGLVHSRLTAGERYDTWRRARAGAVDVMLGPRSALFAPLPDVGLIVLDEEHDASFKSGNTPFFHARETAVEYARILNAAVVLGSATPDLVTYHRAVHGQIRMLQLTKRVTMESNGNDAAQSPDLPPVQTIDMRQELRAGNRSMFSRPLHAALEDCLAKGQQAILFLNRRGTASAVICRACGASVDCPRCELPLTCHENVLLCHRCDYRRGLPARCPACGSDTVRPLGVGTRRVEAEVRRLFPLARPLRWDRDAVEEAGTHDVILDQFASGAANVLVGTQMVAKGLDLPQVTLVGMLLADIGLLLPDYRSAERIFQVLTQVAGRAGRGALAGQAFLQTYMPEHYALITAAAHDYPAFFLKEMEYRRLLGYPPYARLARMVFSHHVEQQARQACEAAANRARIRLEAEELHDSDLIGPVPCFFEKIAGRYRWQIILRSQHPETLIDSPIPEHCQVDVDPVSLL
jgi:primosomal protein N' (replication factor Y) (superfamily II helicase)